MEQTYMHLTNFAINKHSEKFAIDDEGEGGHKRSVSSLMQCANPSPSPNPSPNPSPDPNKRSVSSLMQCATLALAPTLALTLAPT